MAVQIRFRRGTAAQWTSANPILADGEMGVETDTGQFKVGNGSTNWNSLEYGGLQGESGVGPLTIDQKTNNYTLVLSDAAKVIEMNVNFDHFLTVPAESSVPFPIGTQILIVQTGTGKPTISASSGVTVNSANGSLKLSGQWSSAVLLKRGSDQWVAIGDFIV